MFIRFSKRHVQLLALLDCDILYWSMNAVASHVVETSVILVTIFQLQLSYSYGYLVKGLVVVIVICYYLVIVSYR